MTSIDFLIKAHCPGGVPHRPLGEVVAYANARISPSAVTTSTYVGVENLLQKAAGKTDATSVPEYGALIAYSAGDILLGNIRPYLKKIWFADRDGGTNGDVLVIRAVPEFRDIILPRFLYFLLSSDKFFSYDMQWAKGAKMPRGDKAAILRYKIPIPPVEVQEEIVRSLNTFTSLEVELKAELEERRAQYAHYRDTLLTLPAAPNTRMAAMGEIGSLFGGLTGKTKADFTDGNGRFVSYVNVFNNIAANTAADDFVRVEPGETQRSLQRGDVLFTGSSETPEEVAMSSVIIREVSEPLYLNSFSIGYRLHDPSMLDPDFSKHLFRSGEMRKQLVKTASGVTRFNVSKARLAKVEIPIPQLDEQRRIAAILDVFEALVNDPQVGLPAEMTARRAQYEYYRNRLLTFDEVPA